MIGNDDDDEHAPRAPDLRASRRGLLTILAIFAVGAIFVTGLYITAKQNVPPAYNAATPGVPARTLTFVSADLAYDRSKFHGVIKQVSEMKPDFVMLQRVTRHDAHELARSLEMRHAGKVQMYYSPVDPVAENHPGNAILAKWPLYQGRAMVKGNARASGIFAESVIDGRRFLLGCLDLSNGPESASREISGMLQAWRRAGEPPLVAAGVSTDAPADATAGLASVAEGAQTLWASRHWSLRVPSPTSRPDAPHSFVAAEASGQ